MKAKYMALCAIMAAVMAICSWLCIPGEIAFTMQSFAVFFSLGLLGGKHGLISVFIYLAMGSIGLPVFSSFQGGLGVLLGTSGGFLLGFLLAGILYLMMEKIMGKERVVLPGMLMGLLCSYICGSVWYCVMYTQPSWESFLLSLLKCVIPFLLPDLGKLLLAYFLSRRLRRYV